MDAIARLLGIRYWAGLAVVVGFGSAVAAPITYSETVSGDLSGQSVGTVDVGSNTVQGTFCVSSTPSPACPGGDIGMDTDSFVFTLPGGLVVQNISLSWTTVKQGLSDFDAQFLLQGTATSVSDSENVDVDLSGSQPMFATVLPLTTADNYTIDHVGNVPAPNASAWSGFVTYTWTLQVGAAQGAAQVPEPSSLGLLAIALAGLGFRRRKRGAN